MNKAYDTIIIGSGCGGSAAAALMSYLGHKTLLLEKNKVIGGKAPLFEKDGFKLDHGHVLSRSDKGPHGEVLRIVRCRDLIPKFSYAKDWPIKGLLGEQLLDLYPNPVHFFLTGKGFAFARKIGLTLPQALAEAKMNLRILFMTEKQIKHYDNVDFQTFMTPYKGNPYMKSILECCAVGLFGCPAWEVSAGEMIRVFRSSNRCQGAAGYPVNGEGVSAVPNSFVRAAKRLGAEVMTGAAVQNIIIEHGEARGVVVNGERILARRVISNAGIMPTVIKLAGREHFDPGYVRMIENLKYACSGFSFKFALRKKVTKYAWGGDMPLNIAKSYNDMVAGKKPEKFIVMFVASSNIDPSLAPEGCQTISCISGGPVMEPGQFNWDPWMEAVKGQIERLLPGITENTIFCRVENPDQIARFNGRFYGDSVGAAQSARQMGDMRPSMISPVKNLYYVGTDVGWGSVATEAAALSAMYLYDHLKQPQGR